MSAFIVDKSHIDLLVNAAYHGPAGGWDTIDFPLRWSHTHPTRGEGESRQLSPGEMSALGDLLVIECVASVACRYPRDAPEELPGPTDNYYLEPYSFTAPGYTATAPEVLKALDCYEYQSCEHPGWPASEAHAVCKALRRAVLCQVDGYDESPWAWDDTQLATARARQRPRPGAGRGLLVDRPQP